MAAACLETGREASSFPLDLVEESVIPMMVDELQTLEETSLTYVIEGIVDELELERTMLAEAGEEVAQEGAKEAHGPFTFVASGYFNESFLLLNLLSRYDILPPFFFLDFSQRCALIVVFRIF